MSDLATQSNASPSRVSNVVSRLEAQGWVTRHTDEQDRRSTVATLTAAGWDKVVAAAPGHVTAVRRLLIDRLTDAQLAALREVGALVAREVARRPVRGRPDAQRLITAERLAPGLAAQRPDAAQTMQTRAVGLASSRSSPMRAAHLSHVP